MSNRVQPEKVRTTQYLNGGLNTYGKLQAVRTQHYPLHWPAQVICIEWNKLEVVPKSSLCQGMLRLGQTNPTIEEMSAV